jgi:sulfatase-modifying factor enzyme 1
MRNTILAIPAILLIISCSATSAPITPSTSPLNAPITRFPEASSPEPTPPPKAPYNPSAGQEMGPQACPSGMVKVEGNYCPEVRQTCLEWMTKEEADKPWARCKRYQQPSVCLSKQRVHMSYCIDREELHDDAGMPYGDLSWTSAKQMCEERGARLCKEDEWNFAAEGEEMLPYPYGNGYEFSNTICNIERKPIMCGSKVCDYRAKITEYPLCKSKQFQTHNQVGNVDEFIEVPRYRMPSGLTMRSGLKGGHSAGGRHRVRPITKGHNEVFRDPPFEGSRCCKSLDK